MNYLMMLSIGSFFYILILTIIFFIRKKVENPETKIYTALLIILLFEIILELMMRIIAPYMSVLSWLNIIVAKLFAFMSLVWFSVITIYNANISLKGNDTEYAIYKKMIYIVLISSLAIITVLPIEFHYDDGANFYSYTYGSSISFIFFVFFLLMILNIFIIVKNHKMSKKYIPIIMSTILFIISGIIQKLNPSMILNIFIQSLVTFLMYHTIENPDIKLLEEIHKSKEISDNANEEKTLFLYNMTQEIRNITSQINDATDVILESKDFEETYDSARDIKAMTSRFTTMTNDILDISTINSSNIKVYNNKYNIKNIIKQIVNIYTDVCKEKELKFIINIDHNIPDILFGDSIGLKEILTIILNNSTKYTEKGYIEFNVNAIIKNDICRLIFTIEDSGIGINSENINKIKIDNKSLSKANNLITLMNGTMLISSDYRKGTKVKIILDQKIELVENEEISEYEKIFENVKILAIDDSEAGLKIIEKLLKGTNIDLEKATNGKEGLNKIRINKYDMVLLDEELTQISGAELIKKIKEIRNFNTPIILLTKENSYEYNEEYLKMGFNDYILKPIKKEKMLNIINKYSKKEK